MVSKIRIKAVAAALGLALGFSVSGTAWASTTPTEARLSFAKAPSQVVVQDLALLDVFHALTIPVVGVPAARFPEHLAEYAQDSYVKTGSLFEPDLSVLTELNPDLIVLGRRSAKAKEDLVAVAPTVDLSFDQQNLIQSTNQTVTELATLYQRTDTAAPLLERLNQSVQQLKELTAQAGPGLLLLTTQGKMIAQGPESRYAVLFNEYGVQVADIEFPDGKGVVLSAEELAQIQADWIYVIDRDAGVTREDAVPAAQLLAAPALQTMEAIAQQRVVYLDATNWYLLDGAGLTTLQANIDQLIAALSAN